MCLERDGMTAYGYERTFGRLRLRSALPPTPDIRVTTVVERGPVQALALGLVGYYQPFRHPISTSLRFAAVSPCMYRWVVANDE